MNASARPRIRVQSTSGACAAQMTASAGAGLARSRRELGYLGNGSGDATLIDSATRTAAMTPAPVAIDLLALPPPLRIHNWSSITRAADKMNERSTPTRNVRRYPTALRSSCRTTPRNCTPLSSHLYTRVAFPRRTYGRPPLHTTSAPSTYHLTSPRVLRVPVCILPNAHRSLSSGPSAIARAAPGGGSHHLKR